MKNIVLGLVLIGILVSACNEEGPLDLLSNEDGIAIAEMEKEIALAALFNDSLASYINLTGIDNDEQCLYFDRHYHVHDSLYAMHHNNYSHSYGWDDHRMGSGGMMHGHNPNRNFPGSIGHFQRNHDFMDSLHLVHQEYHPGPS